MMKMNDAAGQPYEGATPEQLRSPMVRELLAIHDMFRKELAGMLRFVEELRNGRQALSGPETQRRIQMLVQAGRRYTQMLHHHHHLESAVVFPRLAVDGLEQAVIDRLNADHDDIALLIGDFEGAIRDLAAVEPAVLDNDLRRLAEALQAHLAYEESHVCPFLARYAHWF
jgi:hemerythrin-like domain-containing protein